MNMRAEEGAPDITGALRTEEVAFKGVGGVPSTLLRC